jgi:hypothetical protein
MAVVRPEWLAADKLGPAKSSPEQYAPPHRRAPEKPNDVDQIAFLHRQRDEVEPANETLNALIRRVAGASMEEIDRVIRELENVRDMLRNEGERVTREISGYASLNHASITAMKVISDSLKQWKDTPDKSGERLL